MGDARVAAIIAMEAPDAPGKWNPDRRATAVAGNDLDRFHFVSDVIDRVPKLGYLAGYAKQEMRDKLIEHQQYITRYGDDMPEVKQ
jgi:phosphoketolase